MTPTDFEKLLVKYQQRLSPNAIVEHDKTLKGKSGVTNQCDAVMRFNEGGINFFVIFECKYHSKKIALPYIREFSEKIRDLGAAKGVFVSKNGFTKQVKEYAKFNGIELYTFINYQNTAPKDNNFKIPIAITHHIPKTAQLQTFDLEGIAIDLHTVKTKHFESFQGIPVVYDKEKKEWLTVGAFTEKLLDEYFSDLKNGNGVEIISHRYYTPSYDIESNQEEVHIPLTAINIKYSVIFEKEYGLSWLFLEKLLAFEHEKGNSHTYTLESTSFDGNDIIKNFQRYDSLDVLPVKPAFNISVVNKTFPQEQIQHKLILDELGNIKLDVHNVPKI